VFPEYRLYIPIIGIFIVVGEMKAFKVLERYSVGALVVGAIVMYFLIALNYADTYKDRLTFWKDAAAYSKSSPMTHINLAHAYYAYGQSEMAEEEFQISLALVPGAPTVNYNIGVIRYERGEYSGARQSCLAELKNNPSYGPAVNLLKAMDKAPNGPPL
jgi:tetratricopeptide (TPR) repeat protein